MAERWYAKNKTTKKDEKGNEVIEEKSDSWKEANRRYLDAAYPYIGAREIKDITQRDISAVIEKDSAA